MDDLRRNRGRGHGAIGGRKTTFGAALLALAITALGAFGLSAGPQPQKPAAPVADSPAIETTPAGYQSQALPPPVAAESNESR